MSVLRSLRAWSNPEWPSTPTYAAVARFGVRRSAFVVPFVVAQIAIQFPAGGYWMSAFLVGTVASFAPGYLAGAAVMFDDYGCAALAALATVGVLAGTGATMHALDPGNDLAVGVLAFGAFGSLALGVFGYTAAERATWAAEN